MVSHLVGRRWYSPFGVILYHPCGGHSMAAYEDAQHRSYGKGEKCPGCVDAFQQKVAVKGIER